LLTKHDEPLLLRYTPEADVEGLPMHRVPAEPALHELIDTAADAARGGEFRGDVAEFLHQSLDAAESYSDWFARILARLFRDTPLTLFAPHLSAARELAAPIFERAIHHPLEAAELVNAEGGKLSRLGYAQQVEKGSNECAFFIEVEGRRRNVHYHEGKFTVKQERIELDEAGLLEVLRKQPDLFSANVALRPIVQQHLFPAAAYVAGPGEIAYWGQLKPLFARYNLPMPVVYPRARAVVASEKLERWRTAYGLTLDDLSGPREVLLDAVLRDTRHDPAQAALEQHRPRINEVIRDAAGRVTAESDIAGPMFDALERHAERQLDRIARALAHRNADKATAAARRMDRLQHMYAPWRKPQERVYTVFSFLFDYGWDLIPRLSRELDVNTFEMNEVVL
ncbi:MAG: bacillithiol biosynthesis cysteine-adding enzyme BshC, partial [Candidatus Hydrogenedentes bacterium]|nr:bacillithiol biosynthesis cysteine-adding enzyme BshC [Candidatus Hydrogenedentota bacterium]